MSLAGKYALVTGGSRGIGRGIALKLAAEGAKVGVHYYQNEAAAKETLSGVRRAGSDGVLLRSLESSISTRATTHRGGHLRHRGPHRRNWNTVLKLEAMSGASLTRENRP